MRRSPALLIPTDHPSNLPSQAHKSITRIPRQGDFQRLQHGITLGALLTALLRRNADAFGEETPMADLLLAALFIAVTVTPAVAAALLRSPNKRGF